MVRNILWLSYCKVELRRPERLRNWKCKWIFDVFEIPLKFQFYWPFLSLGSFLRLKLCMWLLPMGAGDIGYVRPASAASEAVSWFVLFGVSNNPLLLGQNWKITPFYWVKILNSPLFIESIFCKCSLLCSKTFLSFRTLHIAYPILVGTPCKYFMEIKFPLSSGI